MSTKRTYKPSKARRIKRHGYRRRLKTLTGKKVIRKRLLKGRKKVSL